MQFTARYTSEDSEIDVIFSADTELVDDYNGRTVYRAINPDTVEVDKLYICGAEVKFSSLPIAAQEAIRELSNELEFE